MWLAGYHLSTHSTASHRSIEAGQYSQDLNTTLGEPLLVETRSGKVQVPIQNR